MSMAGEALDILREEPGWVSIVEIVIRMAPGRGWQLDTSEERLKRHTAVNNGLMRSYRNFLEHDGGRPKNWRIRPDQR